MNLNDRILTPLTIAPNIRSAPSKIILPLDVYQKMAYYAKTADGEASSLGSVKVDNGDIIIEELFSLQSSGTQSTTVLDPQSVSQLMIKKIKEGYDIGKIKCWFHTHGQFDVFWSATDDDTAKNQLKNSSFTISIVMNKKLEVRCRIDIYNDNETRTLDDLPVYVDLTLRGQDHKEMIDDANEHIINEYLYTEYTIDGFGEYDVF